MTEVFKPARLLAEAALKVAVRRAPASRRADLAREWSAELWAIERDGHPTALGRSWLAVAYTVSLACARSFDDYGETGMRTASVKGLLSVAGGLKPPGVALLAPLACYAILYMASLLGWPLSFRLGHSSSIGIIIMRLHLETLIPLVVLGWLGYRLGRRWRLPSLPGPPVVSGMAMAGVTLIATVGLVTAVGLASGYARYGVMVAPTAVGTATWVGLIIAAAAAVTFLAGRGARRTSRLVAAAGALLAVGTAVILSVGARFPSAEAPRIYAWRWFAASLIDVTSGVRMPEVVSISPFTGMYGVVPTHADLMLAVSAFILCYLATATPRRNETAVGEPQPA